MMVQRDLSKSKLIAFRQCPKRLWLEVHRPRLREDSTLTQAIFRTGHQVGEIAQQLYDPTGQGHVIDLKTEGVGPAIRRTRTLLSGRLPIFEAGFAATGAMAFADVVLPVAIEGHRAWRMVEVKSSTSVKDYHLDDIAIQAHVARESGVDLTSVALAHIDTSWTYQGNGDYRGLLIEKDLTEKAFSRGDEVREWIAQAQAIAASEKIPNVPTGLQCTDPFPCGFYLHCHQNEVAAEYPVTWLPRIQSKELKSYILDHAVIDMREVPDALLNERQRLVRDCTIRNEYHFDTEGAKLDLAPYPLPAYFLDFETIQLGVPRWAGTRPFQAIPFQFSLHHLKLDGTLSHQGFLDLSGNDPSREFAHALVDLCLGDNPIFVYNSSFEGGRIFDLSERFTALRDQLLSIRQRLVDMLPIAQARYYHPSQKGSWSIKKVLPAIAPKLRYESLSGVQDGDMAMQAYLEATDPTTSKDRNAGIFEELTAYCALDTLAMVEIWRFFSQRHQSTPTSPLDRGGTFKKEITMSIQQNETIPEINEGDFFKALMAHIMEGAMIPKVQIERAIGPIIGFFLAEALSRLMDAEIITLCAEFPIRKAQIDPSDTGNNQSTNIDWLMFNLDKKELILLELKTTDTTFRPEQASIYQSLQTTIAAERSAGFMLDDLATIGAASQEKGKYQKVLEILERELPGFKAQFSECKAAQVIYLAPQATKPGNWDSAYPNPGWKWVSFSDLPGEIEHPFAAHWPAVHQSLLSIDNLTKSIRNGDIAATAATKNYSHLYTFEELLGHCRADGASIVIGFMNWRKSLPSVSLSQLQAKIYKCDSASDGRGKKIDRNWLSGEEFLAHVSKIKAQ